eukprot:1161133-Pelagomonas_calceolata.AAC.21
MSKHCSADVECEAAGGAGRQPCVHFAGGHMAYVLSFLQECSRYTRYEAQVGTWMPGQKQKNLIVRRKLMGLLQLR